MLHSPPLNIIEEFVPDSQWGLTKTVNLNSVVATLDISLYNKRLTILDYKLLSEQGINELSDLTIRLCKRYNLDKIWCKVRETDIELFIENGFVIEARLIKYYINEDAIICSKFFNKRHMSLTSQRNKEILNRTDLTRRSKTKAKLPDNYTFKIATAKDLRELSNLFNKVFITYPYPVFDPNYLLSTLDHIIYGLVYNPQGVLVAAASAETNQTYKNAEMTDFATLPSERGHGLAASILYKLEQILIEKDFNMLYTIARSTSLSMNKVFKRAGYQYNGTLIRNCNIAGSFEDMNIWCKLL